MSGRARAGLAAILIGTGSLALVPPADAKIVLPFAGRTFSVGQQVVLRVPGCTSRKPCRYVAGVRILLAPSTPTGPTMRPPRTGTVALGTVGRYGMLRFRIPAVAAGFYATEAIWPKPWWTRTWASGAFTVTA